MKTQVEQIKEEIQSEWSKDDLLDTYSSRYMLSEQYHQITVSWLQRTFQIGYNRAYFLLQQIKEHVTKEREQMIKQYIGDWNKPINYKFILERYNRILFDIKNLKQ